MTYFSFSHFSRQRQQGAALLMGLVLLLIMTLLGISSMRSTTLQERMAGAMHDQNLALQTAESALRAGEQELVSTVTLDFTQTGWYDSNESEDRPDWKNNATDTGHVGKKGVVTHEPNDVNWTNPPQFFVERIPVVAADSSQGGSMALGDGTVNTEYDMYRIVARGFGNNTRSVVVVESTYRR